MKKDIWYILIIAVISLLYFQKCESSKFDLKIANNNLEAAKDTITFTKNKLGQTVADKQSVIFDNANLRKIIDKKDVEIREATRNWKSILAAAKLEQKIQIDTLKIPFDVPVKYDFERFFEYKTNYYHVNGVATNTGVTVGKLEMFNTQTIVFGKKRIGMFKTEFRAEVTNSNPLIKTTGLDSWQKIEKQKRWGIGVGFGVDIPTFKPTINLSVNYDLIRF
ncbi:hypothetical protein OD91_0840 [Lutibacter sp. Hel_I_33_5]|uniref:hypothetical protein n=1 Tax=Lutibacter sp. Hel_I_33_5 TaxID=1566289 RepID=UPI0011A70061|nr:hypothetical protein [Lutibacter sp. Hel_I_33_5]TVZ55585.1 hypothetical protein OD91_0840 [Lutibacter sp. Hel_I_33_5]